MKTIGFSLALLLTATLAAQTPLPQGGTATGSQGKALSLTDCIRLAVENNPNSRALLHAGRAAMARVGISRSSYYPAVSLSG
ncbi:MAG: hypothetical protein P8018_13420, partial [Acidobacteriota bacterium]